MELPNAEEILNYHYIHDRGLNNADYVVNAMHEYAKRLLDVVAESADSKKTKFSGFEILRFKELLK